MKDETMQEICRNLDRIAAALEKLEGRGILVWIGEQKPEDN